MWQSMQDVEIKRLKLKLFNYKFYNNLDGNAFVKEKKLKKISFTKNIYKQSDLPPIFVIGFVEFGCEVFFPHFVLPNIVKENRNNKIIFVGWKGREFFYKNIVHEYWEIDEASMHLRQMSRAMSHESWNLRQVEAYLSNFGIVLRSDVVGNNLIEYMCLDCEYKSGSAKHVKGCPSCGSAKLRQSLLSQQSLLKSKLTKLPQISNDVLAWAKNIMPDKAVGIFARNREAYGRNLSSDFYIKLIQLLKRKGYTPVWFGEKHSTLECPDDSIIDITKMQEKNDLEKVIGLISACEFTIQFWTASTRLSMIANTKFFLVECPDQIYGKGQEGIRLKIFNIFDTPFKLFLCNYLKFIESIDNTISLLENSIDDFLINHNYDDTIDMIGK
jgi:hypothetical protein